VIRSNPRRPSEKPMQTNTCEDRPRRVEILGVPVDVVNMASAVAFADRAVRAAGRPACILAVNPEKVMTLRGDRWLLEFFSAADLLIPDGIGVVWAAKMLYGASVSRVAGADLMLELCALAGNRGYGIYLFGAREEVSVAAASKLQAAFPSLRIAGRTNGYLRGSRANALVDEINESGTDVLFVALGSPKQEQWIAENRSRLKVKVIQGVGGTLDTIAGYVKRAPRMWQRWHLEWFYRLLSDPRRARRQAVCPVYACKVLWEKLRG
jgi:N-acetylglucosaminyldiphosphoundecaprenol N-acetyl-beta-D-mannosaminyltransferase